ncbi:MAG: hypothetical protein QOD35_3534 [Nocardioidaceae bacterium]|nr:hypothetical protein [Nocardioidaceae bacterium]
MIAAVLAKVFAATREITSGDEGIGVVTGVLVVCFACQVAWRWLHIRKAPHD